jgi:hypothetical protein
VTDAPLTTEDKLTELTAPALLATIKELHGLRAPLIDALGTVYRSMTDCVGDEWAEEWLGEVWTQIPLNVRVLAGDEDAAAELDEADRLNPEGVSTCLATFREDPMPDTVYCDARGKHSRHTSGGGSEYYAWLDGDEGSGWDPNL